MTDLEQRVLILEKLVVALATTKRPNAGCSFVSDREYTGFTKENVELLRGIARAQYHQMKIWELGTRD